jgi:hypothetical protein
MLSLSPGVRYLHEPFNPLYATPPFAPIDFWYLYLPPEEEAPGYRRYLSGLLRGRYFGLARLGRVRNRFQALMWLKYALLFQKMRHQGGRMLFKDPIALFSTPWLSRWLGFCPVVTVRHPGAFVFSLQRKGWFPQFDSLLAQPALMQGPLRPWKSALEDAHRLSGLERAALMWSVLYDFVDRYREAHWIVRRHEDLSENPLEGFRALYGLLGLEWTAGVAEGIQSRSGAGNPGQARGDRENLRRDSRANRDYWRDKFSASQREAIRRHTAEVFERFYENDPDYSQS